MFYLTTHSTHFIYGYMASDIWLWTIQIVRKETRCCHIGYSFRLTARVLLYAPSHRQDSTYHGLCYTSRGALAGTRNSSMGPYHEGSIWRPIAPWANALTMELHLAPNKWMESSLYPTMNLKCISSWTLKVSPRTLNHLTVSLQETLKVSPRTLNHPTISLQETLKVSPRTLNHPTISLQETLKVSPRP